MKEDIDNFNDVLNNPGKGKVVVYPSLSDPQEIYITDNENLNLARKMWRWSEAGLAYSSTGRGGPWTVGMTKDGQIVADLINTGTLKAIDIMGVTIKGSTISGGKLVSESEKLDLILENGEINWYRKSDNKNIFRQFTEIFTYPERIESLIGFQLKDDNSFTVTTDDRIVSSKTI